MSEEEKEYKIEVPLFEYGELVQFNKMLDNDLDNIVNKLTKQVLRDKELIFMQKIIEKQQKELEELNKCIDKVIFDNQKYLRYGDDERILELANETKLKYFKRFNLEFKKVKMYKKNKRL